MENDLLAQVTSLAERALQAWDLPGARLKLISRRENAVFEVTRAGGARFALRLHRPGYMDAAALHAELDWLAALGAAGVPVPRPVATPGGQSVVRLADGQAHRHASMLTWVDGTPLGTSRAPLIWSTERQAQIFHALGRGMAQLHNVSDAWARPVNFRRHSWDAEGLVGEAPFWGRFWQGGGLDPSQSAHLLSLRDRLAQNLGPLKGLNFGLIHADLVRENVLVTETGVRFIDFDDAGFRWRLFDIATALLPNLDEAGAVQIARSVVAGYRRLRPLSEDDLRHLPMFLVLRALTYVGWSAARPEADPSGERFQRHLARALSLATKWQSGWSPLESNT